MSLDAFYYWLRELRDSGPWGARGEVTSWELNIDGKRLGETGLSLTLQEAEGLVVKGYEKTADTFRLEATWRGNDAFRAFFSAAGEMAERALSQRHLRRIPAIEEEVRRQGRRLRLHDRLINRHTDTLIGMKSRRGRRPGRVRRSVDLKHDRERDAQERALAESVLSEPQGRDSTT